jgi:hypothetical protein
MLLTDQQMALMIWCNTGATDIKLVSDVLLHDPAVPRSLET